MKYIFANIKIPIEFQEDKSYVIHSERAQISIEECKELPPENTGTDANVFSKLQEMLAETDVSKNQEPDEPNLTEKESEKETKSKIFLPLKKQGNKVQTFKNRGPRNSRTMKKRPEDTNSDTSDEPEYPLSEEEEDELEELDV